jgi:hypothetical protein
VGHRRGPLSRVGPARFTSGGCASFARAIYRRPHIISTPGEPGGEPSPGEFVTRVRGAGVLTVNPGPEADWDDVIRVLSMCAPPGSARRWHAARVLHHGGRPAKPGSYPPGAYLGWAS